MEETPEKLKDEFNINLEEMAMAGLYLGHRLSKLHPKMKPYIYGVKNTVHIIDLTKTAVKFKEALAFIKKLAEENKTLLLVGTRIQAKDIVKQTAGALKAPYVSERWIGGAFTNFSQMRRRIDYLKKLEAEIKTDDFEKFSKKEKIRINRELGKLEKKFGGIKNLEKLPDAIFVCDIKKDYLACKEAKAMGIKVIGIADTNVDPILTDFFIPANDDASSSLRYILGKVQEAVMLGRSARGIDKPRVEDDVREKKVAIAAAQE